jgi:hypothetical protein
LPDACCTVVAPKSLRRDTLACSEGKLGASIGRVRNLHHFEMLDQLPGAARLPTAWRVASKHRPELDANKRTNVRQAAGSRELDTPDPGHSRVADGARMDRFRSGRRRPGAPPAPEGFPLDQGAVDCAIHRV